jgi:hypothetical protein
MLNNTNGNRKKIVAIAVLLCFVTVILLSASDMSMLFRTNHDYCHEHNHGYDGAENCVICAHLQKIKTLLKSLDNTVGDVLFMFIFIVALFPVPLLIMKTPVEQRIRMNH